MKKVFILTILIILGTTGCSSKTGCSSQADCAGIPKGYIDNQEFYDTEGFQDYTDYARYTYPSQDVIVNNDDFKEVSSDDVADIKKYLENFRGWMKEANRLDEYDFDENIINEGDYFCIKNKNGEKTNYLDYDYYSIYFFDTETLTLYYMHNNS